MTSQPMHLNDNRTLLTRKQIREQLGVSDRTLSRLIAKREIPLPFKVGRQDRWRPQIVEAWLEQRSNSVDRRKRSV